MKKITLKKLQLQQLKIASLQPVAVAQIKGGLTGPGGTCTCQPVSLFPTACVSAPEYC